MFLIYYDDDEMIYDSSHHHHEHKSSTGLSTTTSGRFPSASVLCQTFALLGHRNVVLVSKDTAARKEKEQASGCLEKESARGTKHGRG